LKDQSGLLTLSFHQELGKDESSRRKPLPRRVGGSRVPTAPGGEAESPEEAGRRDTLAREGAEGIQRFPDLLDHRPHWVDVRAGHLEIEERTSPGHPPVAATPESPRGPGKRRKEGPRLHPGKGSGAAAEDPGGRGEKGEATHSHRIYEASEIVQGTLPRTREENHPPER
jgi:hypothetical protein